MGRDRRAHDRVAGAPRAGVGAVVPGRLQEWHRRQREDRGRRDQGRVAAAPFPVGDQGRPLGDRVDGRQRGLPRDPARRQDAELRRGQRERRMRGHRQGRPRRAPDDRREPREQLEEAREPDSRVRGHRPPGRGRRRAHRRRDDRVAPRRGASGPEGRLPADLRPEHHRCVHRVGRQREGPRRPRGIGEGTPRRARQRELKNANKLTVWPRLAANWPCGQPAVGVVLC
ncbi:LigA [Burkholderia ambifaria]